MSVREDLLAAGILRDAPEWCICAGEPCDQPATSEVMHSLPTGEAVWVPVCDEHLESASSGRRFEYVVEIHGFLG